MIFNTVINPVSFSSGWNFYRVMQNPADTPKDPPKAEPQIDLPEFGAELKIFEDRDPNNLKVYFSQSILGNVPLKTNPDILVLVTSQSIAPQIQISWAENRRIVFLIKEEKFVINSPSGEIEILKTDPQFQSVLQQVLAWTELALQYYRSHSRDPWAGPIDTGTYEKKQKDMSEQVNRHVFLKLYKVTEFLKTKLK